AHLARGVAGSGEDGRAQVEGPLVRVADVEKLAVDTGPIDAAPEEDPRHGRRDAHVDDATKERSRDEIARVEVECEMLKDDLGALLGIDLLLQEIEQGCLVAPIRQLARLVRGVELSRPLARRRNLIE